MSRLWSLQVALLLLAECPGTWGHGYLAFPPMRGGVGGSSMNAYCPQCGNGAGTCGDGGQWGASDMLGYTQGPMTSFSPGQVVEFVVEVTAHHRGHFQFSICDKKLGHATAGAQACLNEHRLQRVAPPGDCVPDDPRGDCQPVHAEYPERWYLPPGTGTHRMRFRIPSGLQCSSCTLQWRWWTANSCVPAADYGCFFSRLAELGWDASSWCGTMCGSCGTSLLQSNGSSALARCGEEFRNCADIAVLGSGLPGPTPRPAPPVGPVPSPSPAPATTPTPAPAAIGACVRNLDCVVNAWCTQESYDTWCAAQGAHGDCPSPQCVRASAATTAPAVTTAAPSTSSGSTSMAASTTTSSAGASAESCVSQSVLACINDYSNYWPKCSPEQAKSNSGPGGYEFGQYCSQAWADELNSVLADPVVDRCGDTEAIQKFLAQVAYETGYYSTVYQPADGGAGLIHMIPGNWQINARDMDILWPGNDYEGKAASMGKDFFQTAAYGWRSVAAWFKRTNGVIGGCGLDLFGESYETQTRCILSRVVDRQEAYDVVGRCMAAEAAAPTPTPAPTTTPLGPSVTPVPSPATTAPPAPEPTTEQPSSTTAAPTASPQTACVPTNYAYRLYCADQSAAGSCPSPWCKVEAEAEPEPEPEPEPTTEQPSPTTAAPTASPQTACVPTNYAYRLYCADQSAAGSCPSPWCEVQGVALHAEKRSTRARRHAFLGASLLQEAVLVAHSLAPAGPQEEL